MIKQAEQPSQYGLSDLITGSKPEIPVLSSDRRGFFRRGYDNLVRRPLQDYRNREQLRASFLDPENASLRVLADPRKTPVSERVVANNPQYRFAMNLGGAPDGSILGGAVRGATEPIFEGMAGSLGPRDKFLGALLAPPLAAGAVRVGHKAYVNPVTQGLFTAGAIAQAPKTVSNLIHGETVKDRATAGAALMSQMFLGRNAIRSLGNLKSVSRSPRVAGALKRISGNIPGLSGTRLGRFFKNPAVSAAATLPAYVYTANRPVPEAPVQEAPAANSSLLTPTSFSDKFVDDLNPYSPMDKLRYGLTKKYAPEFLQDYMSPSEVRQIAGNLDKDLKPISTEVTEKKTETNSDSKEPSGLSTSTKYALGAGLGMPLIYSLMDRIPEPGPDASDKEIETYESAKKRKRRMMLLLALAGAGGGYAAGKYLTPNK